MGVKTNATLFILMMILHQAHSEDDYASLLRLSYSFYQGQMSGALPAWNKLLYSLPGGYKKNSHLTDGSSISKDLSGGFYDAGDYLKCPLPLGWTLSNLVLSCLEFKPAYEAAGQWDTAVNIIKWGTDWMAKAHVTASDAPASNTFVGQLGDKSDHNYFGRPEHATNTRPVYLVDSSTGGADVAAEYAAAFASAAVLFRGVDQAYADAMYKRAQQAFGFAEAYQKNWVTPSGVFQAYITYAQNGYLAHLAWASAWMCKYTPTACATADKYWNAAASSTLQYSLGYDWDATLPGAAVLMLSMNRNVNSARNYLEGTVLAKWEDTSSLCPKAAYSTVCYTPKGLAYYSDWGTLRNTANAMFIATLAGKYGSQKQQHICWARQQMRYAVGSLENTGKSYVVGYGANQPQRPHHRPSACNARYSEPCKAMNQGTCCAEESGVGAGGCCDSNNFFNSHPALITISGALVGGPDQSDSYPDLRNDYQRSEVAVDYNAGFTGAVAGLAYYLKAGSLSACGADATPPPAQPPSPPAVTSPVTPITPVTPPSPPSQPNTPPPTPVTPPTTNSPSPLPSSPAAGCAAGFKTVQPWQKCGGRGDATNCPVGLAAAGLCTDAPWQGYCCTSGFYCMRSNQWYWQCSAGSTTTPPPATSPQPSPSTPAVPPPSSPIAPVTPSPIPITPSPTPVTPGPVPATPSPSPSLPAPGTCTATVPGWQGCGGKGSACPVQLAAAGLCKDAVWPGYCCASGYECKRGSEWWWMCSPSSSPAPPPPPPSTPTTCTTTLKTWAQCGGRGGDCPAALKAAGKCMDSLWEGHCCSYGTACVRQDEYYYQCKPSLTSSKVSSSADTMVSALAVNEPTASVLASIQSFDQLTITTSDTAVANERHSVIITLSRQGIPVESANIQVTFTTESKADGRVSVATLSAVTDAYGSVEVLTPRRVVGVVGDESTVSAVTEDARAQGAKGTVVAQAVSVTFVWV